MKHSSRHYKGVIFDLDGTLLNTAEGILASLLHTIKIMGYKPLSADFMQTFIGPPIKHSLQKAYDLTEDEAYKATEIFRDRYKNHDLFKALPYEGIMSLLKALKDHDIAIGVATLKRDDYAHDILEHFQIDKYCTSICGSDFKSQMDKADVLNKCISETGLSKDEVVLIGDTSSDGSGAAIACVDFIAVTYGFGPKTSKEWESFHPVFTAKNVSELADFLLI